MNRAAAEDRGRRPKPNDGATVDADALEAARRRGRVPDIVPLEEDEEDDEDGDDDHGVTVAARHFVRWEKQAEFRAWTERIAERMRREPGFLGSDVLHEPGNSVHVVIFRFQRLRQMRRWLESDDRASILH